MSKLKTFATDIAANIPAVQTAINFLFEALGLTQSINLNGLKVQVLQKIDEAITAVTAAAGRATHSTLLDALNDAKANFQAAVSNATSIAQIDLSKLLKAFYGLKDAITAAATDLAAPAFADAKTKLEAARDLFAQKFPGRSSFNYDSTNKVVTVGFDFSLAKSITQSLDFASAANLADFLPITLKSNGQHAGSTSAPT